MLCFCYSFHTETNELKQFLPLPLDVQLSAKEFNTEDLLIL